MTSLLIVALLLTVSSPAPIRVQWDPNAAEDGVIVYTLTIDGAAYDVVPAVDPTCACIQQMATFAIGNHTVSVTATNAYGTSDPLTLTFTLKRPNRVTNMWLMR